MNKKIRKLINLISTDLFWIKVKRHNTLRAAFSSAVVRTKIKPTTKQIFKDLNMPCPKKIDDAVEQLARHFAQTNNEIENDLAGILQQFLPEMHRIEQSVTQEKASFIKRVNIARRVPLTQNPIKKFNEKIAKLPKPFK